jgi:hypothetical protein
VSKVAGTGPPPKETRQNPYETPIRGEWKPAPGSGWQHGEIPKPPAGLRQASREAWQTWFTAWFAAHWTPEDLPILRQIVALYDEIERKQASAAQLTQFRQLLDSYGITPKGQQDRRWTRPKAEASKVETEQEPAGKLYGHLRAVGE